MQKIIINMKQVYLRKSETTYYREKQIIRLFTTICLITTATVLFMLLLTNTANAQVQNDVNLLPDTGNVGIGTATPTEKLQVKGNSKLDGNVSVTDSLKVGANMSVGSSLVMQDSLTVGTKMIVNENVVIADSLKVGSSISATEIKGTEVIKTELLSTKGIVGNDGFLILGKEDGDPATGCDTTLIIDYCSRRIFGKSSSTVVPYPGVCIGADNLAYGNNSFAVGRSSWASMENSISIGHFVRSARKNAIVIGSGYLTGSSTNYFVNAKENSLMVGFNQSTETPSLFVGPSEIVNLPGNVGIGTSSPTDKLVIGVNMERISFGSAFNADFGWSTGYIGMNFTRIRTDGQHSTWTASANPNNNGGFVMSTGANGVVYFIPVASTSGSAFSLTDEDLFEMRMIELHPEQINSWAGGPADAFMKVNGNIVCRDLEVTLTNWWDDVFSPGYSMMTISEMQKYIDENGHLPGIPAESEVVGQTMSVQDMNLMLLKKVEELSLYVIELQRQIDEMKNQK